MKVKTYRVRWEIDVEAINTTEAARCAQVCALPPTTATVYEVREHGKERWVTVDLLKKRLDK
jgi:hypothetical protein